MQLYVDLVDIEGSPDGDSSPERYEGNEPEGENEAEDRLMIIKWGAHQCASKYSFVLIEYWFIISIL